MKELLEILNYKANNLEEVCCGLRFEHKFYKDKTNRTELIENIESELELFIEALNKLKALDR